MEESLHSWLRITFNDVFTDSPSGEDMSMTNNEKVHLLGRYIFSLSDDSCLQDVFDEMSSHFGHDLNQFIEISPLFPIEACLICSVSSLSVDRTGFVQAIMRMESNTQAYIMQSIKNNLQQYFEPDQYENENEGRQEENEEEEENLRVGRSANDIDTKEEDDSDIVQSSEIDSIAAATACVQCDALDSMNTSMNTSYRNEEENSGKKDGKQCVDTCVPCDDKIKRIACMESELESLIKRENESEAKLRAEITCQTNKLIDAEILIIDKDEKLQKISGQLDTAISKIQENEVKINDSHRVINQLQIIQDEIDILKPKADKADASEQQLEKLRSRLDELKGQSYFFYFI